MSMSRCSRNVLFIRTFFRRPFSPSKSSVHYAITIIIVEPSQPFAQASVGFSFSPKQITVLCKFVTWLCTY